MASEKPNAKLQSIVQQLIDCYDEREAGNMASLLLAHFYGLDRMALVLNQNFDLNAEVEMQLSQAVAELKRYRPIQHIVGTVEFYGCELAADHRALIPRPETEELVDWIIAENIVDRPTIVDIGTGTGCIPIALKKKLPKASVSAIDVSAEALTLAKQNALSNQVEVDFVELDILQNDLPIERLDIIVSNPPYIPEQEKGSMGKNVLDFEPHLALFVENTEPFLFYKRISELAIQHLNIGGMLYFEIHENYGKEMVKLVEDIGFTNVKLKKDLQGKDRMLQAQKYYR